MDPNQHEVFFKTRFDRVKERLGDRSRGQYEEKTRHGWIQQVDIQKRHYMTSAVLFILLAAVIYADSTRLVFLFVSILIYLWANFLYLTFVGRKLEIRIIEDRLKLFTEEEGQLRLKISHKSILPIFFGRLRIGTDKNLLFQSGEQLVHINQLYFKFAQLEKSEWEIELSFSAIKRGVAQLQLFDLEIDSFFGWGKVYLQTREKMKFEVVVYPKSEKVPGLERILPKKKGEQPSRSSLFEEKSRVLGTREYVNGDPFSQIHWKASARMNTLQSKIYERTSQLSWLFIIDIRTSSIEKKLRGVAYLLHCATKNQIAFSVLVNIKRFGNPSYVVLNAGEGKQQLQAALTMLARLRVENVAIPPSMFARIVHQHALTFPYAIICADKQSYSKWEIPGTTGGYVLEEADGGIRMDRIPYRKQRRTVG